MGDRSVRDLASDIVEEAARIICEDYVTDYRVAKRKAIERLRLSPNIPLPENARVQLAVIAYQQLYGGAEYSQRLALLRQVAVRTMRLLAEFEPRLVGGAVTGAISMGHRVQLHAFADKAEMLDVFFQARGIPYQEDERDYRYAGGVQILTPLCCIEAGEIGVDIAIFPLDGLRRPPLSPADGQTMKRLSLTQAEALVAHR